MALACLALVLAVMLLQDGDQTNTSPSATPSAGEDRDRPTSDATPEPSGEGDTERSPTQGTERFRLESLSYEGEPFETIPIKGTYVGAPAGTTLRVQRQEDDGWVDFPLPAATDEDGRFSAYVELAEPGRNRLRIADPEIGAVSDVLVLRIG